MNEKLWDEQHGIYLDFDLATGRPLQVYVAPNFVPLYAAIPDEGRASRMVDALQNAGFGLSDEPTKSKPSTCERPSSHCAETRTSTSTMTPRPAWGMDPTCSPGRPPSSWT